MPTFASRAFNNGEADAAAALTRQSDETKGRKNTRGFSQSSATARTDDIHTTTTAMKFGSNILGRLAVAAAALVLVTLADDEVNLK